MYNWIYNLKTNTTDTCKNSFTDLYQVSAVKIMQFFFLTPESYFYRYLTNLVIVILLFTVNTLDKDIHYKPDAISCPKGTQEIDQKENNYFLVYVHTLHNFPTSFHMIIQFFAYLCEEILVPSVNKRTSTKRE